MVGFIGAFTTFSIFSLETFYLIEQGNLTKAMLNILISVTACILAIWIGLLCGRGLFYFSDGAIQWSGGVIPYALTIINAILALFHQHVSDYPIAESGDIRRIPCRTDSDYDRCFLTLSGLYLMLYLVEHGHSFEANLNLMLGTFVANSLICIFVIWMGLLIGRQI